MSAHDHLRLVRAVQGEPDVDEPEFQSDLTVDEKADLYGRFLHGVARSGEAGHPITLEPQQLRAAADLLLTLAKATVALRAFIAECPPITDDVAPVPTSTTLGIRIVAEDAQRDPQGDIAGPGSPLTLGAVTRARAHYLAHVARRCARGEAITLDAGLLRSTADLLGRIGYALRARRTGAVDGGPNAS